MSVVYILVISRKYCFFSSRHLKMKTVYNVDFVAFSSDVPKHLLLGGGDVLTN